MLFYFCRQIPITIVSPQKFLFTFLYYFFPSNFFSHFVSYQRFMFLSVYSLWISWKALTYLGTNELLIFPFWGISKRLVDSEITTRVRSFSGGRLKFSFARMYPKHCQKNQLGYAITYDVLLLLAYVNIELVYIKVLNLRVSFT
jgi:hypothetical protein